MSLRPEAQSPFDRNEWFTLARERLRWGANTRVTKLCGHHFCDLTQPQCCSCIDNRPHQTRYYKYVDGRGMAPGAKRWSSYCPGCQIQYGEPEEGPDAMPDVRMERDHGEVVTRCTSCGVFGHPMWECLRNLNHDNNALPEPSRSTAVTVPTSIASSNASSPPPRPQSTASAPSHVSPTASVRTDLRSPSVLPTEPTSSSPSTRMLSPPRPVPRLTGHQQRRARIQAHFERSFGSISDIANDPDYVSPIASLYGNAYARLQGRESERRNRERTGEDVRPPPPLFQFGQARPSHNSTSTSSQASSGRPTTNPVTAEETPSRFSFGASSTLHSPWNRSSTPQSISGSNRATGDREDRTSPFQSRSRNTAHISRPEDNVSQNTRSILENLRRRLEEDDRQLLSTITNTHTPEYAPNSSPHHPPSPPYLDPERFYHLYYPYRLSAESSRFDWNRPTPEDLKPPRPNSPEPLSKEELTISNECKVCFSQHCDILLLPCAHLALCEVPFPHPSLQM